MAMPVCEPATVGTTSLPHPERLKNSDSYSPDWRLILKIISLITITCACYWPALNGEFLWDDAVMVTDNDLIKSFGGLRDIWFSTKPYDYLPLTYSSFWLEWPWWGTDPTGYHLTNLTLHLVGVFLLWKLLRELRLPGSWLGALLFALHPLNVASVAWIAERKNTLSMVFFLACLYCYVRSANVTAGRGRSQWYGCALGFFVFALLSKSSVVMLPCVLLLLCWWRRGVITWKDVAGSMPFFAVSLICGFTTMWFQYHRAMTPEFHDAEKLPLLVRLLMAGHAAWFYLGKALLPTQLSMLYPHWHLGAASWVDFLPALGWLALLAVAWLGRRQWGRAPVVMLLYFTLMLVPVTGLFQMSFFTYSYVSDHFAHLPLLGVVVGLSALLGSWYDQGGLSARLSLPVMALTAGLLAVACTYRAAQFSTAERLWTSTRDVAPQSFAAYNNLGAIALRRGHLAEAENLFRTATHLEPRSFAALDTLAAVLRMEGKWQESASCYETILSIEAKPECYNNLGVVLLELGDTTKARKAFLRALALVPGMSNAYFNLYKTDLAERRLPEAGEALRKCLRINPNDAEAMTALVALALDAETPPPATPTNTPLVFEALVSMADRACQLKGYRDPSSLHVLSRALLAAGRAGEAAEVERKSAVVTASRQQPGSSEASKDRAKRSVSN